LKASVNELKVVFFTGFIIRHVDGVGFVASFLAHASRRPVCPFR